jgi:hypothetical protein
VTYYEKYDICSDGSYITKKQSTEPAAYAYKAFVSGLVEVAAKQEHEDPGQAGESLVGARRGEMLLEHDGEPAQGSVPEKGKQDDEDRPAAGDEAKFVSAHG